MGLTISYTLKYKGDDPAEVLEALRQKALDLPFAEVSPRVEYFKGATADHHLSNDSEYGWALCQASVFVNVSEMVSTVVAPKEVYLFSAWPGEECEEANFGLAKYPATVEYGGKKVSTKQRGWVWYSFCKTQYASNVSLEHFLKCHWTVCALLKEAEKLGILAEVNDEGDFWGKWDYAALSKEVVTWNDNIRGMLHQITSSLGEGFGVISSLK